MTQPQIVIVEPPVSLGAADSLLPHTLLATVSPLLVDPDFSTADSPGICTLLRTILEDLESVPDPRGVSLSLCYQQDKPSPDSKVTLDEEVQSSYTTGSNGGLPSQPRVLAAAPPLTGASLARQADGQTLGGHGDIIKVTFLISLILSLISHLHPRLKMTRRNCWSSQPSPWIWGFLHTTRFF